MYGLGAVLYELLVGRRPIEGRSLEEILHRVRRGEIARPRRICPEISLAIEAVCMKALALRPEDRYATPRALAFDIKAWLADEPVTAFREPFVERARRWSKRHRTGVTGAAASLVVGVIALGIIAAVQAKARIDLDHKNADLIAANEATSKQRRRVEDREKHAIEAVARFRDAVVNEPELKNSISLSALRTRLLKEPLEFFRALRERLESDRDTRSESLELLADAGYGLGVLTVEIGDEGDALDEFQQSLAIYQKLADASPSNLLLQTKLVVLQNSLARQLSEVGDSDGAKKLYVKSRNICYDIVKNTSGSTGARHLLGDSLLGVARQLQEAGESGMAMVHMAEARDILQKLVDENPENFIYKNELASIISKMGGLQRIEGKFDDALSALENSREINRRVLLENPNVIDFQFAIADNNLDIGDLYNSIGKNAEALEAYKLALDIYRLHVEAKSSVVQFQSRLAACYTRVGVALRTAGHSEDAMKSFREARVIEEILENNHRQSLSFRANLSATLNAMASIDMDARRFKAAYELYSQVVERNRKILEANPASAEHREHLFYSLVNLAMAARALGDMETVEEVDNEMSRVDVKLYLSFNTVNRSKLVQAAKLLDGLDSRLSSVIRGDELPTDDDDRIQLGQAAYKAGYYATAARLWGEALTSTPELGEDRKKLLRYNSACAAVLAATGRVKDDPAPDEVLKEILLSKALVWLRLEMDYLRSRIMAGSPSDRKAVRDILSRWQEDTDLFRVRDAKALETLPEQESNRWLKLWADVADLRSRTDYESHDQNK